MVIECDSAARTFDGRSIAALRGETRQELDVLLLHELMGTGIGRSAFIMASIDLFRGLLDADPAMADRFVDVAKAYERALPT